MSTTDTQETTHTQTICTYKLTSMIVLTTQSKKCVLFSEEKPFIVMIVIVCSSQTKPFSTRQKPWGEAGRTWVCHGSTSSGPLWYMLPQRSRPKASKMPKLHSQPSTPSTYLVKCLEPLQLRFSSVDSAKHFVTQLWKIKIYIGEQR